MGKKDINKKDDLKLLVNIKDGILTVVELSFYINDKKLFTRIINFTNVEK